MFSGSTYLISGGTGQFGSILIRTLIDHGANISTHFRSIAKREALLQGISTDPGSRLHLYSGNVATPDGAESWAEAARLQFGRIDGLVHTLGGIHPRQSVAEMDWQTWKQAFDLNVHSAFAITHVLLPDLLRQEKGKIVFISALAGLKGEAGKSAYAAAKGALIRFAESLAEETKASNIQVNVVVPGIIRTPSNLSWGTPEDHAKWVTPEELAEVIVFLLSPRSDAVTGAVIPVIGKL